MFAHTFWGNLLSPFARRTADDVNFNAEYAERYRAHADVNFTAIFAAKLTTLALSESSVKVEGDGERAKLLNGAATALWGDIYRLCARMLGVGGAAAVPYVRGGRLLHSVVPQDRMMINRVVGDTPVSVTFLAETLLKDGDVYCRWSDYTMNGDACIITNRATREGGTRDILSEVPEWSGITPQIRVDGCTKPLFGLFRSPVDSRGAESVYGVPITYGCDSLIDEIHETRRQLSREYADKRVRLGVDERMFARGEAVSDLYLKLHGTGDGALFETFSPEIRDAAYHNRLSELYILLEKAVGTSRGIISDQPASAATATAVKRANADTIAMIERIRASLERGVRDFVAAADTLSSYFGLGRAGKHRLILDWYDPFEDPSEQWKRLLEAHDAGAAERGDLVRWLFPALDEAAVNDKLERLAAEGANDALFGA